METVCKKNRTAVLRWFDILILTAIFWGEGIYNSTYSYILLINNETNIEQNLEFSAADNYAALLMQLILLGIGLLYLWIRKFDFRTWNIRFTPKAVLQGAAIFIAAALIMDVYFYVTAPLFDILPFPAPLHAFFANETVSSIIYAMLNGVYEELFFLGICLAVAKKDLKWAVPFSLIVRTSFHTYQGMISALGIGFVFGILLYLLYRRSKDKNLVPFFIAHAIADVIGLGLIGYLMTGFV